MRLAIIDSQGQRGLDTLREIFPSISITGWEPNDAPEEQHPHGHWCGFLAGVPMSIGAADGRKMEIVFIRAFDHRGVALPGHLGHILSAVEYFQPDIVSRSWGTDDGDDQLQTLYAQAVAQEFRPKWQALQSSIGFLDFAAAGNSDKLDADNDVDFPQRLLENTCNIIGSRNRQGIPSTWSGDGPGVLHTMWGEGVASPNPDGSWLRWMGTSAATPKAAGIAAMLDMQTTEQYRQYVKLRATFPHGAERPHPKWGFGDMEAPWQEWGTIFFARRRDVSRRHFSAIKNKPIQFQDFQPC